MRKYYLTVCAVTICATLVSSGKATDEPGDQRELVSGGLSNYDSKMSDWKEEADRVISNTARFSSVTRELLLIYPVMEKMNFVSRCKKFSSGPLLNEQILTDLEAILDAYKKGNLEKEVAVDRVNNVLGYPKIDS